MNNQNAMENIDKIVLILKFLEISQIEPTKNATLPHIHSEASADKPLNMFEEAKELSGKSNHDPHENICTADINSSFLLISFSPPFISLLL